MVTYSIEAPRLRLRTVEQEHVQASMLAEVGSSFIFFFLFIAHFSLLKLNFSFHIS